MMQYIVPIVALFPGRVIGEPEQTMAETKYSTGGDVEHEVSHGMSFHLWTFCNGCLVDLYDRSLPRHRV
jgi:hypothetical protein